PQHIQRAPQDIPMKVDAQAALFMALGHAAKKTVAEIEDIVPAESLLLSAAYDLAELVPDKVRRASDASEAYKLFFVFESYLRELIVEVLSKNGAEPWWDKVPKDVQDEVTKLEETEEIKIWRSEERRVGKECRYRGSPNH